MLTKFKKLSNFGWSVPIFNQSKIGCDFSDPLGPTRETKNRYVVEIFLFIALEKVK